MSARHELEDSDEEDEVRATLQQLEEAHGPDNVEDKNEDGEEEEDVDGGGDEEEEGNGEDLQDSSEEEEEGQNEYDMNDRFLVADEDEDDEDGEEGTEEEKKRRRRRKRKEAQLDEEDYELIGLRPPRPTEQRKRIRKLADTKQRTTAERLKEDLFGPEDEGLEDEDDDADLAAPAPRREQREDRDLDDALDEEDEFADFLDYDDEGGAPGDGRRRRGRAQGLPPGVSSAALAEAQEIFGDVSDLLEEYGQRKQHRDGDAEDDLDLLEDEDEDEDAAEERQRLAEVRRQERAMRKVTGAVEPEVMARAMLRPEDDVIRATDLPEREQLRPPVAPDNVDHRICAEWIWERLVGNLAREMRQETQIMIHGRKEVDGPPPDGRREWGKHELKEGITDLSKGERAVRERRSTRAIKEWRQDEVEKEQLIHSIEQVLKDMFDSHMEVPFIAMYRKQEADELLAARPGDLPGVTNERESRRRREKRQPEMPVGVVQAHHRRIRRWDVLWWVHGMALRWRALARRKETREKAYQDAMVSTPSTKDQIAVHALLEILRKATSAEEVADVDAKYRLQVSALAESVAALNIEEEVSRKRRPRKTTAYETLKKAGLEEVVRQMAITAEQLGENLDRGYILHDLEPPKSMPEEAAAAFVVPGSAFHSPDLVLHGARQMAISEIVAEPEVRKFVRNVFISEAVISTDPTPQGETILDAFHPYGRVKRLRAKPVEEFDGKEDFLRILQAEKENLLKVNIEVPHNAMVEQLTRPLADLYLSTGMSLAASAWNKQREAILAEALEARLLPAFCAELRARLLADAREAALHVVADRLWDCASRAPLQVKNPDEDEMVERRRFMAVCWGPGDPATTLVMLDDAGQLSDILFAGQLSGNIRRGRQGDELFADPSKSKDAQRIRDFILEHRPHVVMVGATNLHCKQLHADLAHIRDHILEHNPQWLTRSETGDVDLIYADETLAALWQTSAAAQQEMGDQPPLVRRAVALARCALDPLAVLAALCGPSGEILAANLHPLKDLLPKQDLLAVAERVCMTATNQVGVDLNRVAQNSWQAAPLQFLAGLGPRKAQALIRAVQREQHVLTRHDVWEELRLLGRTVFRNCAGFLRIAASGLDMGTAEMDALDDTRIHPSFYDTAKCLAQVALGSANPDPRNGDPLAVDKILSRPQDIEALDLLRVKEKFQDNDWLNKPLCVLRDICFELIQPYGDTRPEAKRLGDEQAFWLLTGESAETLRVGRLVTATVVSAGRDDARCRLTDFGDLDAIVRRGEVSSTKEEAAPGDRMQRGQTITARIKAVVATQWLVELTTRSYDLMDDSHWEQEYCAKEDKYYHVLSEHEKALKAVEKSKAARARAFVSRPIRHPTFKNVNALKATELLKDADVGACLLRPSSRGFTSIILTIKVARATADGRGSDVYMHQEIREGEKETGVGAHLRLGRPLSITLLADRRVEEYEDLDEVLARFAEPLAANIKAVRAHRKFREGVWDGEGGVEEQLRAEKLRQPQGAVYVLGCKLDRPGAFYLAFIINRNPHREYFTVMPDGFYFRRRVWKKVDQVIGVFKQQPNRDAVPEPAAPPAAPPPRGPLHRAAAQLPPAPPPPPPAAAWGNVQPAAVPGGSWGAAQQPQAVQDGGWGAVVQPPLPPQQPQYGQQQQQWQPAPGYPRHPPQPPGYRAY